LAISFNSLKANRVLASASFCKFGEAARPFDATERQLVINISLKNTAEERFVFIETIRSGLTLRF
jgi:hypothetical protein